jgi:hypothetical protein
MTSAVATTADRLQELSEIQRTRVLKMVAKERLKLEAAKDAPVDHYIAKTINESMREYRYTLLELQKLRFELGLDEFRGPTAHVTMRGVSQTTTLPDGSSVQKQIFEAINTIEQIFDARHIPKEVSDGRP